jgi:hypothetical protein
MKRRISATRIALSFGLVSLGVGLAASPASAGLFHRRTVIVESPTVYVAPAPTVYAAPVSTVVTTPATTVVPAPVVDSGVVPSTYVPAVSSSVIAAPVTTTYVPSVTTVPTVVVPTTRVRVIYPRRGYLFGYCSRL